MADSFVEMRHRYLCQSHPALVIITREYENVPVIIK